MPGDMSTIAARLKTFEGVKQQGKKRTSTQSKKKITTVSWPHAAPKPQDLAEAGFYFQPNDAEGDDNVRCFSCDMKLNQWLPTDIPIDEHLLHESNGAGCSWALAVSVSRRGNEENRDPLGEELARARMGTFEKGWPHEHKEGMKCSVEQLANAGWAFNPGEDVDDMDRTTCYYCNLTLGDWKPDDDPFVEHQNRAAACLFFTLIQQYHDTQGQAKTKRKATTKARSTTSKANRASIQSTISNAVSDMAMDDTMADELSTEDIVISQLPPKKTKRTTATKATKSRKKQVIVDVNGDNINSQPVDDEAESKPKKTSKKKAASKVSTTASQDTDITITSQKPHKEKKTQRTSKKPSSRVSNAADQLQEELEDSIVEISHSTKKGLKRTSDGSVKDTETHSLMLDFPTPPQMPKTKAKEPKGSTSKLHTVSNSDNVEQEDDKPPSKKVKKTKTVPARTSVTPVTQPATSVDDDEQAIELEMARIEAEQQRREAQYTNAIGLSQDDFEILKDEVDAEMLDEPLLRHIAMTGSTIRNTPLASPANSDKENDASSLIQESTTETATKPVYMSPTKTTRIPLGLSTPNRASPNRRIGTVSPSKRLLGRAQSTLPWTAIDVENVLLMCQQSTPGKLQEQLATVAGTLLGDERSMTVETWIKSRASQAEEDIKRRGEEMLGVFEREGNRALASLQGLRVIN